MATPDQISDTPHVDAAEDAVLCHDCEGHLKPAEMLSSPYFSGTACLCGSCGVVCDEAGMPLKVSVAGSVPQRIYEMAGAVMTETELLATVTDEVEEVYEFDEE